jgi:hypothetical protein
VSIFGSNIESFDHEMARLDVDGRIVRADYECLERDSRTISDISGLVISTFREFDVPEVGSWLNENQVAGMDMIICSRKGGERARF